MSPSTPRALFALALLAGCGPAPTTYEVDLITTSRCTNRGGEESCDTPADERLTQSLVIEPRGDEVLLLLGERMFLASASTGALEARRELLRTELETGCERATTEVLVVTPDGSDVEGSLEEEVLVTGPETRCGQTPFGDRSLYELRGTEIEGP